MEGLENIEQCFPEINIWQGISQEHWQCSHSDYLLAQSLDEAIGKIRLGEDFAFYDMHLSDAELNMLAAIQPSLFNDVYFEGKAKDTLLKYNEEFSLKEEILAGLKSMAGINFGGRIEQIAAIMYRVASMVIGQSEADEYGIILRSDEEFANKNCSYWHLDKARSEMGVGSSDDLEMRYVLIFKGERTQFKITDAGKKADFIKIAENDEYFWGHDENGCFAGDAINQLFANDQVKSPGEGYGSLHLPGAGGAMHAVADASAAGRVLMVITTCRNKR
jgi:hypothetical protein